MSGAWTLMERHIYDGDGTRRCSVEWDGDEGLYIKWLDDDGCVVHTSSIWGIEDELIAAIEAAKEGEDA